MHFESIDYFFETLLRGNEVMFCFKNKFYSLTPVFKSNIVVGVEIGECYSDNFEIRSVKDLCDYIIGGIRFEDAFYQFEIIDCTIH